MDLNLVNKLVLGCRNFSRVGLLHYIHFWELSKIQTFLLNSKVCVLKLNGLCGATSRRTDFNMLSEDFKEFKFALTGSELLFLLSE